MERKLREEQVIKGQQVDDGKDLITDAAEMMRCGSASGVWTAWNWSKTVFFVFLIQACSLQILRSKEGLAQGMGQMRTQWDALGK